MEPSGRYDKSFRTALLAHLLRTPALSRFLAEGATPHPEQADFETEPERAVLVAAQQVAADLGAGPVTMTAVGHVVVTMRNGGVLDDNMARLTVALLREIYVQELDPTWCLRHLPDFLEEQRLLAAYRQSNVLDLDTHLENVAHARASSRLVARRGRAASIDDDLPPPVEPIPTGFLSIDGPMGGGPGRGEIVMVCGGTGVGKTSFMLNLQRGHALFGYRVGLFQLEIPTDQILQRRASLCSRVDYRTIRRAGVAEDGPSRETIQSQVRQGILDWTGQETIGRMLDFDYSNEDATVEMIEGDILAEARAGEPLDVVMVDWLECLELPARPRHQSQTRRQQIEAFHPTELRHKLITLAAKLVKLAVRHRLLVYIVTQTSFDVQNQSVVRMKNNAESKGTSRRASTFWGLGMSPEDEAAGIIHLTADKTRNDRQFTCQLRRRLDQQRFEDLETAAETPGNHTNLFTTPALNT